MLEKKNAARTCSLVCTSVNYVTENGDSPGICSEKSQLSGMCNQYRNTILRNNLVHDCDVTL
jgi:hypothetical protein